MRTLLAHIQYRFPALLAHLWLLALTLALALALTLFSSSVEAAVGLTRLAAGDDEAVVTVFYPSSAFETNQQRGRFSFNAAIEGEAIRGNRRLLIISHGSGGSPWPHADLARTLVQAGFVVGFADQLGDNWRNSRKSGPWSWKLRPAQVTQAIDRIAAEPRFAKLLTLDRVGVYGMSAGGLTALILAGARWSPSAFARHCQLHRVEDYPACVGLYSSLSGSGFFDRLRITVATWIAATLFTDTAVLACCLPIYPTADMRQCCLPGPGRTANASVS